MSRRLVLRSEPLLRRVGRSKPFYRRGRTAKSEDRRQRTEDSNPSSVVRPPSSVARSLSPTRQSRYGDGAWQRNIQAKTVNGPERESPKRESQD